MREMVDGHKNATGLSVERWKRIGWCSRRVFSRQGQYKIVL